MSSDSDTMEDRVGRVILPLVKEKPFRSLLLRFAVALACVGITAAVVFLEQDGYSNTACEVQDQVSIECGLTAWDSLYYATVTLSTTGYGDIAPVSQAARITNIFLVTPLRFVFLLVLVGTTVEVLTQRFQYERKTKKWEKKLTDHIVVIGYGVKGRSAVNALVDSNIPEKQIVVVAHDEESVREAAEKGFTAVEGDATRESVLRQAGIKRANRIIIATDEDATSVLITMLARKLAPADAKIFSTARESSSADFLRDAGADGAIVTAEAAGRLLSLSLLSKTAGNLMEDLLESGRGLEMVEREITPEELGTSPDDLDAKGELVLAMIRGDHTIRFDEKTPKAFNKGDRIVIIREAKGRSLFGGLGDAPEQTGTSGPADGRRV